jgi:hypothetical protein
VVKHFVSLNFAAVCPHRYRSFGAVLEDTCSTFLQLLDDFCLNTELIYFHTFTIIPIYRGEKNDIFYGFRLTGHSVV